MNNLKAANKTDITKAVDDGKKVYVNSFDWYVRKIDGDYYIVNSDDSRMFSPLLNKQGNLILAHAKYIGI